MRTLATADCLDLNLPSDPQISPQGDVVAYVRRCADPVDDRWTDAVCIVPAEGGQAEVLGAGCDPRWRPDGQALAFVRSGTDGHQLRLWRRGDAQDRSHVLLELDEPPQGLAWSPDGRTLAFVAFVPDDTAEPVVALGAWASSRGPTWAAAPVVTDRLVRRVDGVPEELRPGYHHIFLLDTLSGKARQLSSGPWNHGGPLTRLTKMQLAGRISWAPDGRTLVMSMQRGESLSGDGAGSPLACGIHEFDVTTGAVRRVASFDGPVCGAALSPDGNWMAFVGFRDVGKAFHANVVHVLPRAGGVPRPLHHPEGLEVHSPVHWCPDGSGLLALVPHRGSGCLVRVDLSGRWDVLRRDVGGSVATGYVMAEREFSVAGTGAVAYLRGDPARTDEVAVLQPPPASVAAAVTTEARWLGGRVVAEVETLQLLSGTAALQAWLLRPPDADGLQRPPVIVWLHGGPYAAWGPDFALLPQMWAARGYAVLMINPRGSLGYGEVFAEALHHDFPGADDLVLLDAIDEAVQRLALDSSRVFVAGESGGAVLASWLTGHAQRFRAAALLFGVFDWASMALTVDRCDYFGRYWLPGPPIGGEARDHCWRRSPLARVDRVSTPTLLMCGDHDWRTPLFQSEMYYTALKLNGCEAALARFPGAWHGLDGRPSQLMASIDLTLGWFDRHSSRGSEVS